MEQITSSQIVEKINRGENFIIDFYATWCGPCKVMLNNLTKLNENLLKESMNNSPKVYKFDIDSDKEFAMNEMGIRSVPTIKFFKGGKEYFSKTGIMQPSEMFGIITNN